MKKLERWIISLVFLMVFFIIGYSLSINWYSGMGDNATYSEITLNIAKTGKSTSQVLSTIIDYIFTEKLVTITPEQVENLDLRMHTYNQSTLKFHFTPIQYLIAPLSRIMPINVLWGNLIAVSFVGMLYLSYLILRNNKVSILESLLLVAIISFHPAWNSALFGQIYVDRLFMLSGMMLLFATQMTRPKIWIIALAAVLSALIIEKMALIVGIFLIVYSMLYSGKVDIALRKKLLALGLMIGLFGFMIIRYYLDNNYYSSFLSISSLTNFGHYLSTYPNAYQNLITLMIVNLPLIILAVFDWRALLIALLMMLPNIFGNLGGAEKIGWATHYHTTYFPFLVWAALSGYISLIKRRLSRYYKWGLSMFGGVTVLLYGNMTLLTDFNFRQFRVANIVYQSWPLKAWKIIEDSHDDSGIYAKQLEIERFVKQVIPEGSKVSVPENLMIHLFETSKVYYYPLGLDEADYAVLQVNNDPLLPRFRGFYSYLGSDISEKIDVILFERMIEKGYDVDHPIIMQDIAIIKRGYH